MNERLVKCDKCGIGNLFSGLKKGGFCDNLRCGFLLVNCLKKLIKLYLIWALPYFAG